jgi:hypothetical protein
MKLEVTGFITFGNPNLIAVPEAIASKSEIVIIIGELGAAVPTVILHVMSPFALLPTIPEIAPHGKSCPVVYEPRS